MLSKIRAGLITLITIYMIIAAGSSLYCAVAGRIECAKQVSSLWTFLSGCEPADMQLATRGQYLGIKCAFKGLFWPYYFFARSSNADKLPLQKNDTGTEGEKNVRRLAEKIVQDNNKARGFQIDDHTKLLESHLSGYSIIMEYELSEVMAAIFASDQLALKFDQLMQDKVCAKDGSKAAAAARILFASGYSYQMKYFDSEKRFLHSLTVSKCPS